MTVPNPSSPDRPALQPEAAPLAMAANDGGLEASWQAVLNQHSLVAITDTQGVISYVSPPFLTLSGLQRDELVGQRFGALQSGQHPPEFFLGLWQTLAEGRTWKGEICNRHATGALYWVDTTIVPVTTPDGSVTHHVATFHDITASKLAARSLEQSQQRFRSLLALSTDWFWEQDTDGRFVRLSGGPDHQTQPQNCLLGKCRWELDVDLNDEGWEEHRAAVAARLAFRNFEYRLRLSQAPDDWRWYSVSGEPVFDADGQFTGYRGVSREVTSRRSVQDRLWRLANVDPLTGLPNRMMFQERLAKAVQQGRDQGIPFALALIDIDNFKEINDTLGHDGGDLLLQAVAGRLEGALRQGDMVARLGGDEFAVIIEGVDNVTTLRRPLDAMHEAVAAPVAIGNEMRHCTFSMGVTLFPNDASDSTDLVKNADIALYRAKACGRNRYDFFKIDMRSAVQRRASLLREMETALQTDALMLYYQPVVDLSHGRVTGVEALMRWRHPTLGVLTPGTFARVFEDPGLAARLGQHVVNMASRQAEQWLSQGVDFGRLAINVVAADFADGYFAVNLAATMAQHGVPPSHIGIEVTEGMFLGRSTGHAIAGLQDLHDMGVEIAFDDFGTGYASLTHLKSLPIDRLKIDRSFVSGLTRDGADASIVVAIIQLGKSLGKAVTAEGVETEQQIKLLREMGCHELQGYALARPMPSAELPGFIARIQAGHRADPLALRAA